MTAAIDNQAAAFILLGVVAVVSVVFWAASVLRDHRDRAAFIANAELRLDEATETVEFTEAADEAIALTLPVVEPNVFDDMVRKLPIEQAVYLMPGALGDEVEAWLREGAAS